MMFSQSLRDACFSPCCSCRNVSSSSGNMNDLHRSEKEGLKNENERTMKHTLTWRICWSRRRQSESRRGDSTGRGTLRGQWNPPSACPPGVLPQQSPRKRKKVMRELTNGLKAVLDFFRHHLLVHALQEYANVLRHNALMVTSGYFTRIDFIHEMVYLHVHEIK